MKREMRSGMWPLFASVLFLAAAGLTNAANVRIYALHAGTLKTETQNLLKDTRVGTPMEIPIPFLVIRHGRDWMAFDTGCNGRAGRDPAGYWGEATVKAFAPVLKPEQELREAIKVLGLKPGDFKAVVISHGHLDHAGAIDNFAGTGVPIYFQKAELAEIRRIVAARTAGTAYVLGDFEHLDKLNIREIEGPFDVFGDKSVIAFPTPGHTPGHQSLYVKPAAGKALIYCADALYTLESMEKLIQPAIVADSAGALQTINWLKLQHWTGVTIIPSHDPEYWAKRVWAPKQLVP